MTGIDTTIERIRTIFEDNLWTTSTYEAYGRVHRNERKNAVIPEVYNTTTKDYQDVLLNDFKDGISFFDVDPIRNYEVATVNILFAVNLKTLYPLITERADEEALQTVGLLIRQSGLNVESIVTGLQAYQDYELTDEKSDNMQPYFLFKFETTIYYKLTC